MQHPVCSQRRSSPPSIHPAIKTLNSINLRPVAQSGSASRGPVLCSTQHLAPSIQHHGGSSGPPPLPKKNNCCTTFCPVHNQGSDLSVNGAPKA